MTALFVDSFDHIDTATIVTKYLNTVAPFSIGAFGRFGTQGIRMTTTVGNPRLRQSLPDRATLFMGFALTFSAAPGGADPDTVIARFLDAGTAQVELAVQTGSQRLVIKRGGTVIYTGSTALQAAVSYYVEWMATIHNTTGVAEARVNGTSQGAAFSGNTRVTANNFANQADLCMAGNQAANFDRDDYYLCDDQGTRNNTWLGDVRIEALLPSGVGNSAQWTPSAGANWAAVDEIPPNDDTDYVSSATPGNRDTYAYGNLTTTAGAVLALQFVPYVRKDDANTRTIAPVVREAGVDYVLATLPGISGSYAFQRHVQETNPATTNPFTIAEVNADEFGMDLVS